MVLQREVTPITSIFTSSGWWGDITKNWKATDLKRRLRFSNEFSYDCKFTAFSSQSFKTKLSQAIRWKLKSIWTTERITRAWNSVKRLMIREVEGMIKSGCVPIFIKSQGIAEVLCNSGSWYSALIKPSLLYIFSWQLFIYHKNLDKKNKNKFLMMVFLTLQLMFFEAFREI